MGAPFTLGSEPRAPSACERDNEEEGEDAAAADAIGAALGKSTLAAPSVAPFRAAVTVCKEAPLGGQHSQRRIRGRRAPRMR